MELRRWEELNPEMLRFEMVFTDTDTVTMDDIARVAAAAGVGTARGTGPIRLPEHVLREFCEKWEVATLELFGSAARGEDRPGSDVDVLVTFKPGVQRSWEIIDMEQELERLLDRPVDLVERADVEQSENPIRRRSILERAKRIYPS